MSDAVHSVLQGACWVKLGVCRAFSLTQFNWRKIILYKDCLDLYATNAGDIMIRIVLNRRDVSGHVCRIHASFLAREQLVHIF